MRDEKAPVAMVPVSEAGVVDDAEWNSFRRHQEREALMATLDDALTQVLGDKADQLRAEFSDCVEDGVDSVYSIAQCIDWIRLPLLYPLVSEHFVHARVPPKELTKRERDRLGRQQDRLAKKLGDASEAARAITGGPRWCVQLAEGLDTLAAELTRLSTDEEPPRSPGGPGRRMRASTRLALGLDALFWKPTLPMTERCRLIAGVVSAFIEPVSGEQIRQRIKDLRRRPRCARPRAGHW
jgi:hypothetical protein